MSQPKVSIVTVCYNCEDSIEKTILSVLSQTYSNLEYVIIDGASKDNTISLIQKYKDRIDTIVSEEDNGIYDAMNKGIDRCTGDWILFMNSGDRFANDGVIESVFAEVKIEDGTRIIFGDTILVYPFGNYYYPGLDDKGFHFCHQSTFFEATVTKKYKYDLSYKIVADQRLVFLIEKNGGKKAYVNRTVAYYEAYEGFSAKDALKRLKERRRALEWPYGLSYLRKFLRTVWYQTKSKELSNEEQLNRLKIEVSKQYSRVEF